MVHCKMTVAAPGPSPSGPANETAEPREGPGRVAENVRLAYFFSLPAMTSPMRALAPSACFFRYSR